MSAALAALRGLTTRGRSLLAAGVVLVVLAYVLGLPDLLRVAVFLLVLPLVAVLVVVRTRYRLSCDRSLVPARVPAGRESVVHLGLHNISRLPSGVMLMEDVLPFSLGGRPRFVLQRVEPGGRREVSYPVRSELRGRFQVGPLSVRLSDPFGLCELQRSFAATHDLVVTPRVTALPPVRLGGGRDGGGGGATPSLAAGSSDVTTREYRHGDDLRRVHWRSTARHGELMVRQEEQPRQERATVLLDTRGSAHHGDSAGSSFERAISAAASIGVALGQAGYALALEATGDRPLVAAGLPVSETVLLDALADVSTRRDARLPDVLERLRLRRTDGVLVAVLGTLTDDEAEQVARLPLEASRVAVLVGGGTDRTGRALRQAGWRVAELPPDASLAQVWPLVGVREAGLGALTGGRS